MRTKSNKHDENTKAVKPKRTVFIALS